MSDLVEDEPALGEAPSHERVRALVRLIQKDDAVAALIKSCNEIGEAFLFGGLVRDAIMGDSGTFGDLDIFVSGPLDIEFAQQISRKSRRTNFGGIRLVVGKFDIDIWELPKSYAFRAERGRCVSIPALLQTVCFSTDAVAVSLLTARMISSPAFRKTCRSRVFGFVVRPVGLEILQVVRIARLIVKNGVLPDREISAYFVEGERAFGREALLRAEEKWKGRRVLDAYLMGRVFDICQSVATRASDSQAILFDSETLL